MTEKLSVGAEKIAGEGWKWIEVNIEFPYGHNSHLRQLEGTAVELTADEQATIDALTAERDRIEEEYADAEELPNSVDARLGGIETALTALEDRPVIFDPAEIARAGVFISIARDGTLSVDRGYVRPKDEPASAVDADGEIRPPGDNRSAEACTPPVQRAVITIGGNTDHEEEEDDTIKPLPEA